MPQHRLQVQPDKASCFITAIAMVLDLPVEQVIEEVGVDHKQILHPGREGSYKYRGHNAQDLNEYLFSKGWVLVPIFHKVPITHMYPKSCPMCGGKGKFRGKWQEYNLPLSSSKYGILQYDGHSCAWIDGRVYNPVGRIQDFHTTRLLGFHPMFRIQQDEELPI